MPPSLSTLARATRVGLSAARTSEDARRAAADQRSIALVVAALLERSDHAVHVGAHRGDLMRQILAAAPAGRHLAVDPAPDHALELRAALPSTVHVEAYALAADDEEGEMELLRSPRSTALDPARRPTQPGPLPRMVVPTISLDALVERHDLQPRLIRIDAGGCEGLVLQGARRTIERCQPALLVEHGTSICHGGLGLHTDAFFHQVTDLGLRIFDLAGHGPHALDAFQRAVHGQRIVNYLLRP